MPSYNNFPLLHNKLLNYLLDYRQSKRQDFTFGLRKMNNKNRLEQGYWFQGDNTYILIGFTARGDSDNKTRQLGFGIEPDATGQPNCHICIVFGAEKDQRIRSFYESVIARLSGYKREKPNKPYRYFKRFPKDLDPFKCLDEFLANDFFTIYNMSVTLGLASELWVSEERFEEDLNRIKGFQKSDL